MISICFIFDVPDSFIFETRYFLIISISKYFQQDTHSWNKSDVIKNMFKYLKTCVPGTLKFWTHFF